MKQPKLNGNEHKINKSTLFGQRSLLVGVTTGSDRLKLKLTEARLHAAHVRGSVERARCAGHGTAKSLVACDTARPVFLVGMGGLLYQLADKVAARTYCSTKFHALAKWVGGKLLGQRPPNGHAHVHKTTWLWFWVVGSIRYLIWLRAWVEGPKSNTLSPRFQPFCF